MSLTRWTLRLDGVDYPADGKGAKQTNLDMIRMEREAGIKPGDGYFTQTTAIAWAFARRLGPNPKVTWDEWMARDIDSYQLVEVDPIPARVPEDGEEPAPLDLPASTLGTGTTT